MDGHSNPVRQDANRLIVGIIGLIVDHCHQTTATITVAHTVAIVAHQVQVHSSQQSRPKSIQQWSSKELSASTLQLVIRKS